MKLSRLAFYSLFGLMVACGSTETNTPAADEPVDFDNLSFCDCHIRVEIKGEIARENDPEKKKDLEDELALFNQHCKKYDLKEGANEEERIAYQLDWNQQVAKCL